MLYNQGAKMHSSYAGEVGESDLAFSLRAYAAAQNALTKSRPFCKSFYKRDRDSDHG